LLHPHAGQRHPHEVRGGAVNGIGERLLVGVGERPKWRTEHSDNFDVWLQLEQHAPQIGEAFLGIAEKEMAPGPRGTPQRVSHEIRTVYPVLQVGPEKVEGPNNRHPVRQHQVKPGKALCELRVVPRLAKDVRVGGADRARSRFASERHESLKR
jgi:hypothetical protein